MKELIKTRVKWWKDVRELYYKNMAKHPETAPRMKKGIDEANVKLKKLLYQGEK